MTRPMPSPFWWRSRRLGRQLIIPACAGVGFVTLVPAECFAQSSCVTCYPNCDGSTVAPILNVNDFNCFLNKFSAGDPYANCDGSTTPPVLNIADYTCFLNRFSAGCPAMNVSPASGSLGTVLTMTISSNPGGFAFDAATTAKWTGTFTPTGGSSTSQFSVSFSAAQVRESSATQALIILGDGTFSNAPSIEQLTSAGALDGQLIVTFGSGAVHYQCVSMQTVGDASGWRKIRYPRGFGGSQPPELWVDPIEIEVYMLSLLPNGSNPPEQQLQFATGFHFTPIVRVVKSSQTQASAPGSMLVDVVSRTGAGAEITRLQDVSLTLLPASTDSSYLIYANLTRPLIMVDTPLNPVSYPNVHVLLGQAGGLAAVVPSIN